MNYSQRKFRVWDTLTEQYLENLALQHLSIDVWGNVTNLHNGSGGKELVLETSTGVLDKNRIMIFEGDIIEYDETAIGGDKGSGDVVYTTSMELYGPSFVIWCIDNQGYRNFPFNAKIISNIHK